MSDFNKRQYQFIASEIVATRQYVIGIGGDTRSLDLFTDRLAEAFERENPRFDALKFAQAIHESGKR